MTDHGEPIREPSKDLFLPKTSGKPQPQVFPFAKGFWDGTKIGELRIQECPACGHRQWYPRTNCEECGERGLGWTKTKGLGTVYSFTTIRQVVRNTETFEREIPYAFCIVELEEGVRMMAQVIDCPPEDVRVGTKVEVCFEEIGTVSVVKFRPIASAKPE